MIFCLELYNIFVMFTKTARSFLKLTFYLFFVFSYVCLAGSNSRHESQGVNLTRHTLEQPEDTTTAHNEAGKRFHSHHNPPSVILHVIHTAALSA